MKDTDDLEDWGFPLDRLFREAIADVATGAVIIAIITRFTTKEIEEMFEEEEDNE